MGLSSCRHLFLVLSVVISFVSVSLNVAHYFAYSTDSYHDLHSESILWTSGLSYSPVRSHLTCEFCGKKFQSRRDTDGHINAVHLKLKPFICHCGKGFSYYQHLHVHKKHCSQPAVLKSEVYISPWIFTCLDLCSPFLSDMIKVGIIAELVAK
jgi:hypothetical protein